MRWHLQPLPALGSEQTVERTGLWRVLPARSAPSYVAVPFLLGLTGFLSGKGEAAFSLPSLPSDVPQEQAVEENLCLILEVRRVRRAASISLPSLLLQQCQAGGKALLYLSAWIQVESPQLDSSLRTLQSPLVFLSWNSTRAALHENPAAVHRVLSRFSWSCHSSDGSLTLTVSQIWHVLLPTNAEKGFKRVSLRAVERAKADKPKLG